MPTSTRIVVAVHTLAALAVNGGKPLRSEDLANSANTGAVVIRGLLSRLSDAGLTKSQLGAGGGALLAMPVKRIRLLDVYNAVEDTELFSLPRTPPCIACPVGSNNQEATHPALHRARKRARGRTFQVHDRRYCCRGGADREVSTSAILRFLPSMCRCVIDIYTWSNAGAWRARRCVFRRYFLPRSWGLGAVAATAA
jgi:DNA-binding IscR family transcriptional regulator